MRLVLDLNLLLLPRAPGNKIEDNLLKNMG